MNLSGRAALATGSTSGIGLGVARALAAAAAGNVINRHRRTDAVTHLRSALAVRHAVLACGAQADLRRQPADSACAVGLSPAAQDLRPMQKIAAAEQVKGDFSLSVGPATGDPEKDIFTDLVNNLESVRRQDGNATHQQRLSRSTPRRSMFERVTRLTASATGFGHWQHSTSQGRFLVMDTAILDAAVSTPTLDAVEQFVNTLRNAFDDRAHAVALAMHEQASWTFEHERIDLLSAVLVLLRLDGRRTGLPLVLSNISRYHYDKVKTAGELSHELAGCPPHVCE